MATDNAATSTTKIAIVTGGSRGIGRNTVLSLARRGVDSIFTYKSNQAEARKMNESFFLFLGCLLLGRLRSLRRL